MHPSVVVSSVVQRPPITIFDLDAVGSTPDFTQAYLNAVMQKYLDFKKGMRENQCSTVTTAITEQLIQVEKDLRSAEDEMIEFQKQNNIGFITEEGNSAAAYLVRLNQQYAQLQTEYQLLSLLDLDQNLDRAQGKNDGTTPPSTQATDDKTSGLAFSDVGPEADYLKAKQQLQLLKAERETLSKDLRPKHPKIIKLNDEIAKQEKLIEVFRADAVEKLSTRRVSIGSRWKNFRGKTRDWEAKPSASGHGLDQSNGLKGKLAGRKRSN